jgi:hypothetical protein
MSFRVSLRDCFFASSCWLMKSGYGFEMRVAAVCRRRWLPTTQSVPYVDPTQANTIREADVVVRFGSQLSMTGDAWNLAAAIECKSSMAKPWVALMVPDAVTRATVCTIQVFSRQRILLILTLFIQELPSVGPADRTTAEVVEHDRDAAAVKLNQPAERRRDQVKLEHGERHGFG